MTESDKIKQEIYNNVAKFLKLQKKQDVFIPKQRKISYCEPIYDEKELNAAIDVLLSGWLPEGKNTEQFEKEWSNYNNIPETVLVNSGSSALLLALSTLKNKFIKNHLNEGDEVITSALTFSTNLSSIVLNNLTSVFVDVDENYNLNPDLIENMISEKTKAILVTHHLGNPAQMNKIMEIAKKHNLFVIEDCCGAHGAIYNGKKVGTIGDLGCFSFHGAHAIFMGEGGAITMKDASFAPTIRSLKTCGVYDIRNQNKDPAWEEELSKLPDYDERTVTMNPGYKLRVLDLQPAIGLQQLPRLDQFIKKRQENVNFYNENLKKYEKFLTLPKATNNSSPSWFSYPITIKKYTPFKREALIKHLNEHNIETRPLLGGNLIKHPAFLNIKHRSSELPNTEFFSKNSFYIGCWPGLTREMRDFVVSTFDSFLQKYL
ncbi:MAG: aminotransferase class V-fold PLP-dependent enzyme [Nanoarchaeota archaeon]